MADKRQQAGLPIVNSPETVSLLRSQWRRYEKALELTPEKVVIDTSTNKADVFYHSETRTNDRLDPLFNILSTTISDGQLALLRQRFREVSQEGQVITLRGEYTNVAGENPIRQDGSAVVVNEQRFYQALIPESGNRIEKYGKDEDAGKLPHGSRIGYSCTCPDYMGRTDRLDLYALGEGTRQWSNMGEMGGCKHLLSLRIITNDQNVVPSDIPMQITKAEQLKKARGQGRNIIGKSMIQPRSPKFV